MSEVSILPDCQTLGCDTNAPVLLRSRVTGGEVVLCESCASEYYRQGWEVIRGDVELIDDE